MRPDQDVPRAESLELLYHLLGIIPAYRDRVQPLLRSLCAGVADADLPAATAGLLAAAPHVRAAALIALPSVLSLAEGVPPQGQPLADMHTARYDPSEANADAAAALWEDAGCELPEGEAAWFVDALVGHLASPHADVRAAAAAALAAAVEAAPARVAAAMEAVVKLYASGEDEALRRRAQEARAAAAAAAAGAPAGGKSSKGLGGLEQEERKLQVMSLDDSDDDEGGLGAGAAEAARRTAARLGAAVALRCLAPVLGSKEVAASLDFLIGSGLADPDPAVREAMVAAGVAVVDLHGAAHAGRLMPLFGGYLEKRPGAGGRDEGRYDLVREGVVVLMGTLAAHLERGDPEVRGDMGWPAGRDHFESCMRASASGALNQPV